ncbi:MAG: hypothetical protein ACQESG_03740 [Nanobdellota archaeon]
MLHLKESEKLSFADIAHLISRDQRSVWTLYNRASEKLGTDFYRFETTRILIPLSVFSDRALSSMEAVIEYLKQSGMKNKDIAAAIGRDPRNISLLLSRIKKKRGGMK